MPESPHVETSRECEIVCYPTVTLYGDPGAIIIFWNTMKLGEVVANQTREGKLISSDLLAHVSPLGWEHINLTGIYSWDIEHQMAEGFRPLRLPGRILRAA